MTVAPKVATAIKLVAIDLDGTLLDSEHRISERNGAAIRRAIELGIEIIIATGKTRSSAIDLIETLGIKSPGIYMQGLITYNADGSVRRRQIMDECVAKQVMALADSFAFRAVTYNDNRSFSLQPDAVTARLSEFGNPRSEKVPNWQWVLDNAEINKIVLYGEEHRVTDLREEIERIHDRDVHVTRVNIDGMMEVLPYDTSKGQSLSILMQELDVAPEQTMAIGDGENDIEMLQAAAIGIAMGNAHQLLKDVADDIVPCNEEDGVAVALEKYVIGEGTDSR